MKETNQNRVCLLVDIDSFSVQVLQKSIAPETIGKPCVVAITGDDVTVKLSAINYEAKEAGILRSDTVEEAVSKYPDVNVLRFPALATHTTRKKSDMSIQEQATKDLIDAAVEYCERYEEKTRPIVHLASIDEFYLDVTALVESLMRKSNSAEKGIAHTHFEELDNMKYKFIVEDVDGQTDVKTWKPRDAVEERLHHGLKIASEVVQTVRDKTGLNASVGIGWNKLIAKLACGLNKPLAVTLVLPAAFTQVSNRIPIPSVPWLGAAAGKAIMMNLKVTPEKDGGSGDSKESVPVKYMGDLTSFTLDQLAGVRLRDDAERLIGTVNGQNIYDAIHGIDDSPVTLKLRHP